MTNKQKLKSITKLLSESTFSGIPPKETLSQIRDLAAIHAAAQADEWGRLRCGNCGALAGGNYCPECGASLRRAV